MSIIYNISGSDMKILFINPSLRPGLEGHLYLPVGLGYVVTYVKEYGYDFDILDIDAGNYSNEYVENFIKKNKYDVICLGSIVTHYRWMKWCINTIKDYQPELPFFGFPQWHQTGIAEYCLKTVLYA